MYGVCKDFQKPICAHVSTFCVQINVIVSSNLSHVKIWHLQPKHYIDALTRELLQCFSCLPFAPFCFALAFLVMFWVHIVHALGILGGVKGYVTCFKDPLHMLLGMLRAPWGAL